VGPGAEGGPLVGSGAEEGPLVAHRGEWQAARGRGGRKVEPGGMGRATGLLVGEPEAPFSVVVEDWEGVAKGDLAMGDLAEAMGDLAEGGSVAETLGGCISSTTLSRRFSEAFGHPGLSQYPFRLTIDGCLRSPGRRFHTLPSACTAPLPRRGSKALRPTRPCT